MIGEMGRGARVIDQGDPGTPVRGTHCACPVAHDIGEQGRMWKMCSALGRTDVRSSGAVIHGNPRHFKREVKYHARIHLLPTSGLADSPKTSSLLIEAARFVARE